MKKIILYTSEQNGQLNKLLQNNLADHFAMTIVGEREISSLGAGEELLIIQTTQLSKFTVSDAIVVFDESDTPDTALQIDNSCICLAASDNRHWLKILSGSHAKVIACGMSPKDTFTYSSRGETSIAISLQRELLTLQGNTVEPMELVISCYAPVRSDTLLFYVAILVLLDIVTEGAEHELTLRCL